MTVNRTTLLDLPLPVTGTESGTWGDTTNNGLTQYLDIAIAGTLVLSTDADVTLTSTEGDSSATNIGATTAQYAILRWTATGSTTRNITALAQSKTYVVINATGGTQSIVLRGAGPTTGVTIISGEKALCVWNGSDFVKVSSSAAAGGSNTQVQYNSSGVLAGSSNMTFDGTSLTLGGNPTLSAGTDNGVLYLNGSKVATSGSALTFDGTNLSIVNSGSAYLNIQSLQSYINLKSTGAFNPFINFYSSTSTLEAQIQGVAGSAAMVFALGSTPTEAMRLTSTGLKVGTTSDFSSAKVVTDGGGIGILNKGLLRSSTNGVLQVSADPNNAYASSQISFDVDGSTVATLDSSGNLGLGVTPSAWNTVTAAQIKSASLASYNNHAYFNANAFYDGSWKYIATGFAAKYEQVSSVHAWYTAPSGTAGNAITFTQAMTLTSDAKLGVGVTSPGAIIHAQVNSASAALTGKFENTSAASRSLVDNVCGSMQSRWAVEADGGIVGFGNVSNHLLYFFTNNTERARITSGGYFKASNNGTYYGGTGSYHEFRNSTDEFTQRNTNTNATTPYGYYIQYTAAAPNGTGSQFLYCEDNAALRAEIRSNGGLANYSGNDVNLSDRREKTNFAPAKDYLDTICAIPVQTFNYIDQSEDDPGLTLGVVAQDVQAVAPELVMESNWGTEENPKMRLSIYQTDLQYALMKCIQEQQALITSLTARVALLEGN